MEIRREATQQRGARWRGHDEQIAFRSGDGLDGLVVTGLLVGYRGFPLVEASAHFGFKCRPRGGKQTVLGFHEGKVAGILFVSRPRKEMQFVSGAGGSDVEDAAHFLRFACAANAIDPGLGGAAVGAFGLERRD